MTLNAHASQLLNILNSMKNDDEKDIEGFSAGIVPLAVHNNNLYVIGAIKDKFYPAAPWQFTFPIGYSEGGSAKETATREFMEEVVASIHSNRELLFAQIKDGKIKAMPLYVGNESNMETAKSTLENTIKRLKGSINIDIEFGKDEHMKMVDLGYLTNTTSPNSKGKQWKDVGYVVTLGNLDSIAVIDAEEFEGKRLDRQIVAIPIYSLKADNLFKDIANVGALAFYNGEWVPFSEYRKSNEWSKRVDELYEYPDAHIGKDYIPFVPHPLLLKMYDPSFCNLMKKEDIPAITRPSEGLEDFLIGMKKYQQSRHE